jgi:hypothetical protein
MTSYATDLLYRENGGIEVVLLWRPEAGELLVSVSDAASGDSFVLEVDGGCALDAFYHPYAYAARLGIPFGAGGVSSRT